MTNSSGSSAGPRRTGPERPSGRVGLGVMLVVAALLPLVVVTTRPQVAEAQAPAATPHIFQADADGLIPNRRPANVAFLGVSDGVIRVEDSREATAGAEHGFAVPPEPNTMQQVLKQATWGEAGSGEVVDTAIGFLTSYSSPELVVLRGSSGRWTDRDETVPMSLTWHGAQEDGFAQATEVPLDGVGQGEAPVGVEIVNNGNDSTYLVLATDRALYAFTSGEDAGEVRFEQRFVKTYGSNERVLGIHHSPRWAASPAEQFQLPALQSEVFGVLLAYPQQEVLGLDLTRVHFVGSGGFVSMAEVFPITSLDLGVLSQSFRYRGEATGGDVRYSLSQTRVRVAGGSAEQSVSQEVRVDVNLTTSDHGVRSTEQWSGRTSAMGEAGNPHNLPPTTLRRVSASTCGDLATGFDAVYFRNSVRTVEADSFPVEAHVMCASSGGGGGVVVGGYDQVLSSGLRAVPQVEVDAGAGGVVVQPQISLSLPCLEQIRYALRLQNPMQSGDSSPASILAALHSDSEYMRDTSGWRNTYRCSAMVPANDWPFSTTHGSAGNVQATISAPVAPPDAEPLGPRSVATGAEIVTRSLQVPPPSGSGPTQAYPPIEWRSSEARTVLPTPDGAPAGMSPGIFLNRLPSTDVVEMVRLTGASASCGRFPPTDGQEQGDRLPGEQPGDICTPTSALGGPIPIAVMAAPPYVQGTGQSAQITPEFANGTSATQEASRSTSTSVGVSLEVETGVEFDAGVAKVEVNATVGVGYERQTESSTSEALTVSKAIGYGGSLTNDTIVTNNVRYLEYRGVVESDSVGVATGQETVIRVPIGNVVTSQALPDLLANAETARWWRPDGPFGAGLRGILTHVPGMPGTYLGASSDPDAELNDYCIGDLDPQQGVQEVRRGTPAASNPFLGVRSDLDALPQILTGVWGAATAGDDVTTQRSNIEFGTEFSDSFLESNTISASVALEVKAGAFGGSVSVKPTVSAAGSWGSSFSSSLGTDTVFSGSVGSIPDARLQSEQFGWRMFVCKREIAPGLPVWVQGYQVREYGGVYRERGASAPRDLGAVTIDGPRRSEVVSTTPELRWSQPVGTVDHYDVEVEAVGRPDAREFAAPAVDGSGTVLAGWPAVSRRTPSTSFTVPGDQALHPNQLYRWRVVSNNFFHRSETSAWAYFVTRSRPPTATDQAVSTPVDTPKAITLTGSDPEGGPLTYAVVTPPAHGTLSGTPPLLTYTPEAGRTGEDSFTFTVSDEAQSATGTVTISVDPVPVGDGWLPFGSWSDATDQLHQWLIGRSPTEAERALWVDRFTAGTHTLPDLVVALRASTDNVDVVDPVVRLYSAYFLRIPDRDGIHYWTDRLRRGTSLKWVADFFAASAEFRRRYGSLSDRQFVERIYQNILGRPGERAGVDFWTEQLASGRRSRGWVMIGFSQSPEYQDAQRANVDAAALWISLGDITPSVAQRNVVAQALRAGVPPALVVRDLLRDPAVAAHVAR